jgi:hypothetical protein
MATCCCRGVLIRQGGLDMNNLKQVKSTLQQIRKVFNYMEENGSINRYEAYKNGVCHLAARIQNLEELGLVYNYIDEDNVKDFHCLAHNRIRRYFIDWKLMDASAVEHFSGWCDE